MRIGINALFLIPGKVGGTESYLRRLVANLQAEDSDHELVLYTNRENAGSFPLSPRTREVRLGVRAENRPARILVEQTALAWRARRDRLDVLHSPGYTAPLLPGCANVVTIHDLNYHFFPEDWSRAALLANRLLIPRVASSATRIVTISQTSKQSIRDVLGVPDDRIAVVYHGVDGNLVPVGPADLARVRARYGLDGDYVYSVTASHPHKNLDGLLAAYERFAAGLDGKAPPLVITGIKGRDHEAIEARVARTRGRVVLTGWIDDRDLSALYHGARLFVFASRYEGFGFPVLEAMAAGVPVVSSHASALGEVVGNGGLTCDPDDAPRMAALMTDAFRDERLRGELIARGRARAAEFSWARTVAGTLAAYREAVGGRRG